MPCPAVDNHLRRSPAHEQWLAVIKERDEARAECERLRADLDVTGYVERTDALRRERDEARDEVERLRARLREAGGE